MSGPLDIVHSFHNAFRRDMAYIDDSIVSIAHSGGDLTTSLERLHILGEILDYHAQGEETAVFPAVEKLAPQVVNAYIMDHRELDTMVNGLEAIRQTQDPLITARATAVLRSHLRIHLGKEDVYLYPLLQKRTTESEQASIAKLMATKVPPDRYPTIIQWLFPLLDLEDQVVATKVWMTLMPPQTFEGLKKLIKQTVADTWVELTRQIPELSNTSTR
jgi:iron-sulfur cluster repair protein YtfE (RIC family)